MATCATGQHIEGNACVSDLKIGDLEWWGNVFNGIWTSALDIAKNQAPGITITAPANNASAVYPASFTITADAVDTFPGRVASVDFYSVLGTQTILLGSDSSAPYSIFWQNMAIGKYEIKARAVDDMGAITWASIHVEIKANLAPTNVKITSLKSTYSDGVDVLRNANINTGYLAGIGKSSDDPIEMHGPTDLTFGLSANDTDGTIYSVEVFYTQWPLTAQHSVCVLSGSSNTFTDSTNCKWQNIPANSGTQYYELFARATDNNGGYTDTPKVYITVTNDSPVVEIRNLTVTGADQGTILWDYKAHGSLANATMPINGNIIITARIYEDIAVNNIKYFKNLDLATETCSNCPEDCGSCTVAPSCPDSVCSGTETCTSCPADCGVCAVTPVRGDHICNGGKDLINEDTVSHKVLWDVEEGKYYYDAKFWWKNVPQGVYKLKLQVIDNGGLTDDPLLFNFVDLAAVPETCNDNIDNDHDRVQDNGCLPINFVFTGEARVYYLMWVKPHETEDWQYISTPSDINLGLIYGLNGGASAASKNFIYSALSGYYDIRVHFSPDTYAWVYHLSVAYYTSFNLNLTPGSASSVVSIDSVTASGPSASGHANSCTKQTNGSYNCTLATPRCNDPGVGCSGGYLNPTPPGVGTAIFHVFVHSQSDRTIVITSPAADAKFSNMFGQPTIPISVSATSPNSITKVDFYYKDSAGTTKLIGTDTTSPYSFNGDLSGFTKLAVGFYNIFAKFTDSAGEVTSAPVTIEIISTSGIIN